MRGSRVAQLLDESKTAVDRVVNSEMPSWLRYGRALIALLVALEYPGYMLFGLAGINAEDKSWESYKHLRTLYSELKHVGKSTEGYQMVAKAMSRIASEQEIIAATLTGHSAMMHANHTNSPDPSDHFVTLVANKSHMVNNCCGEFIAMLSNHMKIMIDRCTIKKDEELDEVISKGHLSFLGETLSTEQCKGFIGIWINMRGLYACTRIQWGYEETFTIADHMPNKLPSLRSESSNMMMS